MNINYMSFILTIILILKSDNFIYGKLNKLLKVEHKNSCVNYIYLYKIQDDECGQCKVNKTFVKYAKLFSELFFESLERKKIRSFLFDKIFWFSFIINGRTVFTNCFFCSFKC